MRRRAFGVALTASAILRTFATQAQQSVKSARVGFLSGMPDSPVIASRVRAFTGEMRKLGWSEGQNLTIVQRYQNQSGIDLVQSVAELISSNINVLVVAGPEIAVRTVAKATKTIPIAMIAVNFDPIEHGLVASLARPGGNVTGIFLRQVELAQKQLELMSQALPGRTRAAVLYEMRYRSTNLPPPAKGRSV